MSDSQGGSVRVTPEVIEIESSGPENFTATIHCFDGRTVTKCGRSVGEALLNLWRFIEETMNSSRSVHAFVEFNRMACTAAKKWNDAHPGDNLLMLNPTEKRT